ncbi:MAG: TlpA disulfide reductase family protein [Candidatus Pseudobacter hemicellulosilyticus]|uniref:TlpA disulfide reductase family protein n=1 Tax=Candidatus Pseudobacter hemicellulosilyticus TaxID=3121375 RepID=A0AAJ6BFC8_9BACT|nr:MAG: TlpA disulfide reductase family protein [Pseudobacter sp.]
MKLISTCLLLLIPFVGLFAQKATLHLTVSGAPSIEEATLTSYNFRDGYLHETDDWFWEITVPLDKGKGSCSLDLEEPVFLFLEVNEGNRYELFVSPGDKLQVTITCKGDKEQITVTGKGSNNNQATKWNERPEGYDAYRSDTLPDNILKDLHQNYLTDSSRLAKYIGTYHPSRAYSAARRLDLLYTPLNQYHEFWGNQKFKFMNKPNKAERSRPWERALDSMLRRYPLNNEAALIARNYVDLVGRFSTRKREALIDSFNTDRAAFLQSWYGDSVNGEAAYIDDGENLFEEKIINRYFSGSVREFAYAHLIHGAIGDKEDNLLEIYDRMQQKYPQSKYPKYLEPKLAGLRQKDARQLNERMVFVPNGDSLKTFREVLDLVKGKTVVMDMWGTWCGPCRKEIDRNSQALKDHFKGKEVVFLYIANFDIHKPAAWRKLIAYYNMEGTHILANYALTDDIMKTVKGKGYPTYIIVKKDGSFELSKAGYPMDRQKMIDQVEAAL